MKSFLLLLLFTAALSLSAFRPGDQVGDLPGKLKWINCSPFNLGVIPKADRHNFPPYRVLVFMLSRSSGSDQVIEILERARRNLSGDLLIAAVFPDSEADIRAFQKRHPDVRVRYAFDAERKVTPRFMAGSMLFPMAFLMDQDGKIIWCGEAVDLPEAAGNAVAGKLESKNQRKIALLLDEMQQRMRTGELRPLQNTAARIFKLDPANPTAIRMTLFSLENQGDITGAWLFLQERLKAAPASVRLCYTALDLLGRHPQLRTHLPALAKEFFDRASTPDEVIAFAETLLVNFPSDTATFEAVLNMVNRKNLSGLTPRQKTNLAVVTARLRYLLGDLNGAIRCQQQAVNGFTEAKNLPAAKAAGEQLDFYRKLQELSRRVY